MILPNEIAVLAEQYSVLVENYIHSDVCKSDMLKDIYDKIAYVKAEYSGYIIPGYGNGADYLVPILYKAILSK